MGIGNAKVDTQLENDQLTPGSNVKGKVNIQGGSAEQQVDRINVFLMTEAVREKDDKKYYEKIAMQKYTITDSFVIGEGEEKQVDFEFLLPIQTPPTIGRTKVWIQTGLDIPQAIDPKDRDYLEVEAHPYMETVLNALTNNLGFHLREVEMEYSSRLGYVQEFEFSPSPEFRSDLDELECVFFIREDQIELVLQVDRRAKGLGGLFAEAIGTDESNVRVSFTKAELEKGTAHIAGELRGLIRQFG